MNEYEQIRNMLGKIRLIKEEVENARILDDDTSTESSKDGDRIMFDDIDTIGLLQSQESLSDEAKNNITAVVGKFIHDTGLILNSVIIYVEKNRVILTSDTVKNPGADIVRSITFDSNDENPKLEVIQGTIELSIDMTSLLQNIQMVYNNNQVGRVVLVGATLNKI